MRPWLLFAALSLTPLSSAQRWQVSPCSPAHEHSGRREHACERRSATVPAGSTFNVVSGNGNGGIEVKGEDRRDIRIDAEVMAEARVKDDAEMLMHSVLIKADGSSVTDTGPHMLINKSYSVNYVLHVPRHLAMDLHTSNGGIAIAHLDGKIRFETTNGGVSLADLSGDVKGETTNGGLEVTLTGEGWRGAGLQAETTNGGVEIALPAQYSARLETATVNGDIDLGFPVKVQGNIGKDLKVNLGNGGPVVHATTVNGGVSLKHS